MKALLQRVTRATVTVKGAAIGEIDQGLLVFLGVVPEDTVATAVWLAEKTLSLRVFADPPAESPEDPPPKAMNRSVRDINGGVLVVSQFTLAADTRKGNRPGFSTAAPPEQAQVLYQTFVDHLKAAWPNVATGEFGADMQVALVNDGPVTLLLER